MPRRNRHNDKWSGLEKFPLFSLPLLAVIEVIDRLAPLELFVFSAISKKTNALAKRKHKFHLSINANNRGTLELLCGNQLFWKIILYDQYYKYMFKKSERQLKIGKVAIRMVEDSNTSLDTFWKDESEGYRRMPQLLCNMFNIQTISLNLEICGDSFVPKLLDGIQKQKLKPKINKVRVLTEFLNRCTYQTILDHLSDVPELTITADTPWYFRYDHVRPYPKEYFSIKHAHWFPLRDLMLLLKCRSIKIWDLELSSQEVNTFLKKWMEGCRLEVVDVRVRRVNIDFAIEGLNVTPEDKLLKIDGSKKVTRCCYSIQRSSDKFVATLWDWDGSFVMKTGQ